MEKPNGPLTAEALAGPGQLKKHEIDGTAGYVYVQSLPYTFVTEVMSGEDYDWRPDAAVIIKHGTVTEAGEPVFQSDEQVEAFLSGPFSRVLGLATAIFEQTGMSDAGAVELEKN